VMSYRPPSVTTGNGWLSWLSIVTAST
jgi:hypothetical protein